MDPSAHVPVCTNSMCKSFGRTIPPLSVIDLISVHVIFTWSVTGYEQGYSQSRLIPSNPYFEVNMATEAMNAFLFAAVETAAEKNAEGKVQPPMAEIILRFALVFLYWQRFIAKPLCFICL